MPPRGPDAPFAAWLFRLRAIIGELLVVPLVGLTAVIAAAREAWLLAGMLGLATIGSALLVRWRWRVAHPIDEAHPTFRQLRSRPLRELLTRPADCSQGEQEGP